MTRRGCARRQLAEPFDGMDRGELLTPLLAQHLQKKFNVVAVSQCGRNSGPKYGQNLLDIATSMTSLSTPFVHSNTVSKGAGSAEFAAGAVNIRRIRPASWFDSLSSVK